MPGKTIRTINIQIPAPLAARTAELILEALDDEDIVLNNYVAYFEAAATHATPCVRLEECWGSRKRPTSGPRSMLCTCECSRGVDCGGCGHAGCIWRQEVRV